MTDLEFVMSYLAKHIELIGERVNKTKTSMQMSYAFHGRIDDEVMGPDRWFTDEEMGRGKLVGRSTIRRSGGLNRDPVTIFVYGFIRDNLELFRKVDESRTTQDTP